MRIAGFFEVGAECTVSATLWALAKQGRIQPAFVQMAMRELGLEVEKAHPQIV
jgi:pyruvate dehydrogenase complex dehydrogenase (E1) component